MESMTDPGGRSAAIWTIRRALAANLVEINEVIGASKSHWRQSREYLQTALPLLAVDESYLAENLCFEVIDVSSRVVGFFAVADDGGEKSLGHLWVRPDRLGRGIGRLACEHVFALARKRRWPELLVVPEPPAEGFYRRLGFEDTGLRVDSRVPGGPMFSVLKRHFDDTENGRVAGLSHVTITVRDLDHAFAFYTRVLGFTPLALRTQRSAYLRSRTTWLVLVQDERKGRGPEDYAHLAFLATGPNFDALVQRLAECGARVWQENTSPGRSVYFEDPSGNRLEIHEQTWRDRLGWLQRHPSDGVSVFV